MIEKVTLEKLLRMGDGYVLEFTNRTLQEFIADSVQRDIYDDAYAYAGNSKAKRLRAFWRIEPNEIVGKCLTDLFTYMRCTTDEQPDEMLLEQCQTTANRLLRDSGVEDTSPLTFVSYASPDLDAAMAVVDLLTDAGLRTWFDKKDLKGGQEWEYVIRKQISAASLVLICLSNNAADRKGFFHKEMRYAVDEALQLPQGKVFIMPVCLDDCPIPDDLRKWHALRLFERGESRKLLRSIGSAVECGSRARNEAHEAFESAMREHNAK